MEDATELLLGALRRQAADDKQLAEAMMSAGLAINVMESDIDIAELLVSENGQEDWVDVEFEVALDSGSIVHVCRDSDAPGYILEESNGSRRGQNFLVGNGAKMPNMGEKRLNLEIEQGDAMGRIASVFQIAHVTRPLMSVGRVCDEGHSVTFNATTAEVRNKDGKVVGTFRRKDGGLYVAKMRLKQPFVRQG